MGGQNEPKESQTDGQSRDVATDLTEEELIEFYKEKCGRLKAEIDKYREECNQREKENFELQTKIDELREIVQESVEIKTQLESMGIDVDELEQRC